MLKATQQVGKLKNEPLPRPHSYAPARLPSESLPRLSSTHHPGMVF